MRRLSDPPPGGFWGGGGAEEVLVVACVACCRAGLFVVSIAFAGMKTVETSTPSEALLPWI